MYSYLSPGPVCAVNDNYGTFVEDILALPYIMNWEFFAFMLR